MSDVAIADLLASLGLEGAAAARGRAALEEAGLTNPRKTRMAAGKVERAKAAVDERLARLCASCAERVDACGREVVRVAPAFCANCGGSRNARGLTELRAACERAGIRRVVVVGGSPDVRRELAALGDALELRLVDGLARRTAAQADNDLAWADLVVIAGSSELAHRVSTLYTRSRGNGPPVITAARRGVEAIAAAVVEHAARR
jgi:hypothetical protein